MLPKNNEILIITHLTKQNINKQLSLQNLLSRVHFKVKVTRINSEKALLLLWMYFKNEFENVT